MSIVASEFVVGHPQVDGRCYVIERHTDHLGVVHEREYLAPAEADHAGIAAAYAVQLAEALAVGEFEEIIGGA